MKKTTEKIIGTYNEDGMFVPSLSASIYALRHEGENVPKIEIRITGYDPDYYDEEPIIRRIDVGEICCDNIVASLYQLINNRVCGLADSPYSISYELLWCGRTVANVYSRERLLYIDWFDGINHEGRSIFECNRRCYKIV